MKHKILHTCIFTIASGILIAANCVANYYSYQITEILDPSTTIVAGDSDSETVSEDIAEEGAVLLKNDANILPFGNIDKINLFGYASTASVYGGSGSGAVNTDACTTLIQALENSGIQNNDDLTDMYKSWASDNGLPSDGSRETTPIYNSDWSLEEPTTSSSIFRATNLDTCSDFSEYAIFTLARVSGEGTDLPKGENGDGTSDYLALTDTEKKDIERLVEQFGDKLIVLENSANPIEIAPLNELGVSTIVYLPAPGQYGFNSLVNLMIGQNYDGEDISFSGRLASTYEVDHSTSPSYYTSGTLGTHNYTGESSKAYVDYQEDIYVGYRYYETRALTEGEDWYDENVLYPFGYGLSYTTFDQKIDSISIASLDADVETGYEITATIEVTNNGDVSGKDAVQLYVTKPYSEGGIAKSAVDLVDFGKTESLEPGESTKVVLEFMAKDLASFDYNDSNDNGFSGYEIEKGDYVISLRSNAHDAIFEGGDKQEKTISVGTDIQLNKDEATGNEIKSLFDFANGDDQGIDYLNRDEWNVSEYSSSNRVATDSVVDNEVSELKSNAFDNDDIYGTEMPTTEANTNYELKWNYTDEEILENEEAPDLNSSGSNYDEAQKTLIEWDEEDYDSDNWDKLLDQMSADDYEVLISGGGYQTAEIQSINKSLTKDVDGPQGLKLDQGGVGTNSSYGTAYPCEVMVAQTYNKSLAYTYGLSIGQEGVDSKISGWYGPAMNLHRNAYEGRYYEYLSEDPIISGYQSAYMIKGSLEEGMRPYMKHFALNEQEQNRDDIVTWCNEQAMRELYLKPFEFCVKIGKVNCVMSSFNDIGPVWAGACSPLLTDLLRTEWGFEGMVLSDYYASWMPTDAAIRAGNDIMLSPTQNTNLTLNSNNVGQVVAARNSCKNILFAVSHSVSNIEIESRTGLAEWEIWGIVVDSTVGIGLVTYFIFIWFDPRGRKNKKEKIKIK
jgi:beta-glucosidase